MFHIKSVNNKKNLTEERKIMRNCASEILIRTFINPTQNEAWCGKSLNVKNKSQTSGVVTCCQ